MIISVTEDPTAILLTLTVRSLATDTKIAVRIQENIYQRQLRQAGADVIVSSTKIGALLLADAVNSRYIVPFVNEMLSTRGRATLVERPASRREIGCMSNEVPGAVVVGLERGGKVASFYEQPPCRIEAGDTLVVIQSARIPEPSADSLC